MRYTKNENNKYITDSLDESIQMLGKLEDMIDNIRDEQESLSEQLEELRKEGQEKSYRFRELMGRKLINTAFISLLESKIGDSWKQ